MSAAAILIVLAAALAHASWNILAHSARQSGVPFLWAGCIASTLVWLPVIPFAGGMGNTDLRAFAIGTTVSAALHAGYMLVLQRGYNAGNMSTVYATARGTAPTITVLVAVAVLGERPSMPALAGIVAVIGGIVAISLVDRGARTEGTRADGAVQFGLLTGAAIATYTLWDAHAVRTFDIPPVAFMVGCTAAQVPLYTVALGRQLPTVMPLVRDQWRRLLLFGAVSPLSYILVLAAISMAPVSLVAPLREVSVVLISLYGALVLREGRPGPRLAAAAVVTGGIGLIAVST